MITGSLSDEEGRFTLEGIASGNYEVVCSFVGYQSSTKKIQIQLTAIYLAPKNTPQGRQLSRSSIDLGVKKNIWKNKGELTFSFSDIFNTFGIREEITEKDFTALYENYFETQVVRVGMKWKW